MKQNPIADRQTLIAKIAEQNNLTQVKADEVIKMFCKGVEGVLENGYQGLILPRYFSLVAREQDIKTSYNIHTKTFQDRKPFNRFVFKPSKKWKKLINRGD